MLSEKNQITIMFVMSKAIYYDTETTGVKADKDRIIEIAAFDPLENRSFSQLIYPGIEIPNEATAIHHITNEMVKDAPPFKEVWPQFIQFCEGNVILIAHNNDGFDKHFLIEECRRNELPVPNFRYVDSLKWSRKYRRDLPRHSLQHLREVFRIPPNQAHRALDDVIVLHQVFSKMIDDLPIEEVFSLLQEKSSLPRTMPFGKHRGKSLVELPKNYIRWLHENSVLDKLENEPLKAALIQLNLLPT